MTKNESFGPESPLFEEQGHAILELGLILPIIILVFVGTVEFTNFFRYREYMTLVGREAANVAFRECFDRGEQQCGVGELSKIDVCLTKNSQDITKALKGRLPTAGLTLSFWEWDPDAEQAELLGITLDYTSKDPTRSNWSDVRVKKQLKAVMEKHEVIVIAEVFFQFPFFFDNPQGAYAKPIMPDLELYHAVVY